MSIWCDNESDHRRQAEDDHRWGYKDRDMYNERHYDECARVYADEWDRRERRAEEDREQERAEHEASERRAAARRHQEQEEYDYDQSRQLAEYDRQYEEEQYNLAMCAQSCHVLHGADSHGNRCYCGVARYWTPAPSPKGGA